MAKLKSTSPTVVKTAQAETETVQLETPNVIDTQSALEISPSEGVIVEVDLDKPWSDWEPTNTSRADLSAAVTRVGDDNAIHLYSRDDEELGRIDTDGLKMLSWFSGFPAEFIQKLPIDIQTQVINARLRNSKPVDSTFVKEGDLLKSIVPGSRAFLSHQEVAQLAYDAVAANIDGDPIVKTCHRNGHLEIRIMTPRNDEITPVVGDVLNYGVEYRHIYGLNSEARLFAERLACLNGMTTANEVYSWANKSMWSRESQMEWIMQAATNALSKADQLTNRARQMANTQYGGDPRSALFERLHAARIPRRFWQDVFAEFEKEPGNSEWHLQNAVTRFLSHSDRVTNTLRSSGMETAGNWISEFDMVTARLPRPLAVRAGAQIVEAAV